MKARLASTSEKGVPHMIDVENSNEGGKRSGSTGSEARYASHTGAQTCFSPIVGKLVTVVVGRKDYLLSNKAKFYFFIFISKAFFRER